MRRLNKELRRPPPDSSSSSRGQWHQSGWAGRLDGPLRSVIARTANARNGRATTKLHRQLDDEVDNSSSSDNSGGGGAITAIAKISLRFAKQLSVGERRRDSLLLIKHQHNEQKILFPHSGLIPDVHIYWG